MGASGWKGIQRLKEKENEEVFKILVFGTGNAWWTHKEYIKDSEVIAFLDNYPKAKSIRYKGKELPILKPEECKLEYDFIVIASSCHKEIVRQLIGMGVAEDKLIPITDTVYVINHKNICMQIISQSYYEKYDSLEQTKKYDNMMQLMGKLAVSQISSAQSINSLHDVEFKIYSQWGEDGIIQWLIHKIPIKNKTFIEFGVENYKESNTRFLMINDNWSGMVIDGDPENITYIKNDTIYWRHDLKAEAAFITRENINDLLALGEFDPDLGLLSVDIDGNDYWVLEAINVVQPRIIVCEYNGVFGGKEKIAIPYKADFYRTDAHYSNLYFGASLEALKYLCRKKGYTYVGTNSNGCNAFFVRDDLTDYLDMASINTAYEPSRFRESKGQNGAMTMVSGADKLKLIADMEVVDVETMEVKKISSLQSEEENET